MNTWRGLHRRRLSLPGMIGVPCIYILGIRHILKPGVIIRWSRMLAVRLHLSRPLCPSLASSKTVYGFIFTICESASFGNYKVSVRGQVGQGIFYHWSPLVCEWQTTFKGEYLATHDVWLYIISKSVNHLLRIYWGAFSNIIWTRYYGSYTWNRSD